MSRRPRPPLKKVRRTIDSFFRRSSTTSGTAFILIHWSLHPFSFCSLVLNAITVLVITHVHLCIFQIRSTWPPFWRQFDVSFKTLVALCSLQLNSVQLVCVLCGQFPAILNRILILVQFLANVNSLSRSLYAIARPSVVCLSVVCNVRAPYSAV